MRRIETKGYHPATMLEVYWHGYLSRIQSSRRPGRNAGLLTETTASANCGHRRTRVHSFKAAVPMSQ